MRILHRLKRARGSSLIGVVAAVSILAVIATGLPVLFAENQASKAQQYQMMQAYYSARGELEWAMRQIKYDGNWWPLPTRYLASETFWADRTGGKIVATGKKGSGLAYYSITDPDPPNMGKCFSINTTDAQIIASQKKLMYVTFNRTSNCGVNLYITAMTVSWTPDEGQRYFQIQLGGDAMNYNNPPLKSGDIATLSPAFLLSDNLVTSLQFIKWRDVDAFATSPTITVVFSFSDGSSQIATFTPLFVP